MNDLRGNLSLLYDFYLVGKESSFSKAAETNHLSQSNLTRSVKILEETLKLQLFNRDNKGTELTKDGERLYGELDPIFNSLSNSIILKQNVLEKITGNLTIGTTRNIADNRLNDYISEFNKIYPHVKINILIDSATNLNEYLIGHKIDVLIDYLPHINYSEKYEVKVVAIGDFKTNFACSKELFASGASKINSLDDLQNYNLVVPGSSRRRQLLDEVIQINNTNLKIVAEMPDSELMAKFIVSNNCIGYFIDEEIEKYNLKKINLNIDLPSNNIGLIYLKNNVNSSAKKFIDLLINNLEK